MSKATPSITSEVEDLRSLSSEMAGYVHAILSAIITLSPMPNKQSTIGDLAACAQYVMASLDGSIFTACKQITQVSQEVH